jgi:hypothetical protein
MKHIEISEKYQKWIMKYYSEQHSKPVFFTWIIDGSDKNEVDKLLTNKSNKIITAKTEKKLLKKISDSKLKLPDSKRTKKWLKESLKCKKLISVKLDLRNIESKISLNELKVKDLEKIVDFINLYEDYKQQLGKKGDKLKSRKGELIKVWEYFYDEIFFATKKRSNKKKNKFKKLKINNKKLLKEFRSIVINFEKSLSEK